MDNAIQHLKQLAPIAEAIVYIAQHAAEIEGIEETLSQRKQELEIAEARLTEISSLCDKAKAGAEQAKASMIEGQSKLEQMIESTRNEANRIIQDAKTQAAIDGKAITDSFVREHGTWQAKINALKKIKDNLDEEVASKLVAHDAVQASIDSLKARLG